MVMIRQLSMGPDLEIQILSRQLNPVMTILTGNQKRVLMTAVNVGGEPDDIL